MHKSALRRGVALIAVATAAAFFGLSMPANAQTHAQTHAQVRAVQAASSSCPSSDSTHHYSCPVPGITCVAKQVTRTNPLGWRYWARCSGEPTGYSDSYEYRLSMKCVYVKGWSTIHGEWETTHYSNNACNYDGKTKYFSTEFQFT